MRFMLIACEVLTREICHCVARSPHVVDLHFTAKGSHDDSAYLRRVIQDRIDSCEDSDTRYDAILLGFGLCGNSAEGLRAGTIPLVIPRAHDCCTLFLGSKEKFKEHFGRKQSTPFQAAGYIERGASKVRAASAVTDKLGFNTAYDEYVKKYGEENAALIWETLHPKPKATEEDRQVVFIDVPETGFLGYAGNCKRQAEGEGKEFIHLQGDIRLVRNLIFGDWPDSEFLVVQPHHAITATYDLDCVMGQTET